MIEDVYSDLRSAARQRALSVVKATTGSLTNVSVSGSTFTRASGSFITDKFGAGDEIYASGFAAGAINGRAMIVALAATTMQVDRTLATESAGATVSIVAGLPQGRAWENESYSPVVGQPFVEESLRPISSPPIGNNGAGAVVRHEVNYVLNLVYPANKRALAIEKMAGALLKHLKPGLGLSYGVAAARVMSGERRALIVDPAWVRCPVMITFALNTAD